MHWRCQVGRVVFWVPPKTPQSSFRSFWRSTVPSVYIAIDNGSFCNAAGTAHVAVIRCLINCLSGSSLIIMRVVVTSAPNGIVIVVAAQSERVLIRYRNRMSLSVANVGLRVIVHLYRTGYDRCTCECASFSPRHSIIIMSYFNIAYIYYIDMKGNVYRIRGSEMLYTSKPSMCTSKSIYVELY